MKMYLALLLALTSFSTQAGFPPTTAKGQSEATKTTTFNLEAPYSQVTTTGPSTRLLETGNNNVLIDPGAEGSSVSWGVYNNGVVDTPTTGLGGTATVTTQNSAVSPLSGKKSLLFTKPSGSVKGQGMSISFTIPVSMTYKVIRLSFDYAVNSGVYTDDEIEFFVLDTVSGEVKPFTPSKLKNHSLPSETFAPNGEFQTSGSTSYRLIAHVRGTSGSAYSLQFDNLFVGRQAKNYGSPITDAVAKTFTLINAGNATVAGTVSSVGSKAIFYGKITIGATLPTGTIQLILPAGYNLSKTLNFQDSSVAAFSNNNFYAGSASSISLNTIQFYPSAGGTAAWSATIPSTWVVGNYIEFTITAEIQGWSSSTIMSSDADTRVVSFSGYSNATVMTAGVTPLSLTTRKDSHGAWSGTAYIIPVAGDYDVRAFWAASGNSNLSIYIDGSLNRLMCVYNTSTGINPSSVILENLRAGQVITFRANSGVTSLSGSDYSFSISRISGPSQIAASESVSALYTGAPPTGTLGVAFNVVKFGTKVKDSHGAYNPATGEYKAPMSGTYDISAQLIIQGTATVGVGYATIAIKIDGVEKYSNINGAINVGMFPQINVKSVPLLAGQKVTIHAATQSVTSPIINAAAEFNFFSLSRSGNY